MFFGNTITKKVEKKRRFENELEVLKKEQKVQSEKVLKDFDARQMRLNDDVNAQVKSLEAQKNATVAAINAQIASLKAEKDAKSQLLKEELKVTLDKTINDYDRKIVSKTNDIKKLGYEIEAEQKSMQDIINPLQPNAPAEKTTGPIGFEKKVLLEEKKTKTNKK